MGKYFGTDGMRGLVGKDLTCLDAYKIGRCLALRSNGIKALIGRDTRISSKMLEHALCAGILEGGGDAYTLDVVPTACVSYLLNEEFDFGVMISASHNPFEDNGIKLFNNLGEKLDEDTTDEIEMYIDGIKELPLPRCGADIGTSIDYKEAQNKYKSHLISCASASLDGLRIGLDSANGSAYKMARECFLSLGATVFEIGNDPNGININEQCGATHPRALSNFVLKNGLDMGFSYDGDADRCIAIDHDGEIINGDKILYILGRELKRSGELNASTIVATVMSNAGLDVALKKEGISLVKTKVGDRFVYEEMKANGYTLGGEQSGHIIVSKYASTGDGILTSLLLSCISSREQKSLGELSSGVEVFPQVSKNVRVKSKKDALDSTALWDKVRLHEKALDGGRILIRASGTEPLIRILVEGKSLPLCEEIADSLAKIIEATSNA